MIRIDDGHPFNWRDYIKLDDSYKDRFDDNGHVKERYQHAKDRVEYEKMATQTLEKVMSQISLIPEVQEAIKQSYELGKQRLERTHEVYGDAVREDTRMTLLIAGERSGGAYDFISHRLRIDPEEIRRFLLPTSDGSQHTFSLQDVIIHELQHAADPTLTIDRDLQMKKEAASAALEKFFQDFPASNLREEYQNTGAIAGVPIRAVIEANNPIQLEEALNNMNGLVRSHLNPDNLKAEALEKSSYLLNYPDAEGRFMNRVVSLYMQNSFRKAYEDAEDRLDELPAVDRANQITQKYFASPVREGYTLTIQKSSPVIQHAEYQQLISDTRAMAQRNLVVPIHELALLTTECSRAELIKNACSDLRNAGVTNIDHNAASHSQHSLPRQTHAPVKGK